MKSSSKLFPVALLKADFWNELSEDIYSIKPNNSPDKTVEIAVTRLGLPEYCGGNLDRGQPVVLVHDLFRNRTQWMRKTRTRPEAIAETLAKLGLDVWAIEMRGHGLSNQNMEPKQNSLSQFAAFDLTAVQAFISEQNPKAAIWVGKGEGAVAVLDAYSSAKLITDKVRCIVLDDFKGWPWLNVNRVPFVPSVKRLLIRKKYFQKEGLPEFEPRVIWKERLKSQWLFGKRMNCVGQSLVKALKEHPPKLAYVISSSKRNEAVTKINPEAQGYANLIEAVKDQLA